MNPSLLVPMLPLASSLDDTNSVRLNVMLAEGGAFITRVRVYASPCDPNSTSSRFALFAVPYVRRSNFPQRPYLVSPASVVDTAHDRPGSFHEYTMNAPVRALVVRLPGERVSGKAFVTLGGLEIMHDPSAFARVSSPSKGEPDFRSCFSYLLENTRFSDCTLRLAGGHVVPAHRCVLAARSLFFRNVFEGGFRGAVESMPEVHIDHRAELFMPVLRYIYTDRLELGSIDSAVGVWILADQYQLEALKVLVEEHVEHNLTTKKAIELCSSGDLLLHDQLRELITVFIAKRFDSCMDSTALVHIPPMVLHDVLCAVKALKEVSGLLAAVRS